MLALRRRCASALWAVVPKSVGRLYFGGGFLSCSQPSLSTTFEVERGTNDARSGPLNDSSKRSASSNYNTPHKHPTEIDDHTSGAEPAKGGTSNEDEDRILGEIESGILDVFSDAYCNKHLVYGMLELILVRLMPELAEKGVIELWEDRLS